MRSVGAPRDAFVSMLEWGEEEMRSAKKYLTREETFVSEAIFLGAPENLGFFFFFYALDARRFSGAVSAMRPKCRLRVPIFCFFLTWQWVVPDVVRFVSADF